MAFTLSGRTGGAPNLPPRPGREEKAAMLVFSRCMKYNGFRKETIKTEQVSGSPVFRIRTWN